MPRLKGWIVAVASDPAALLFVLAVILLIGILAGMALAARTRRRAEPQETAGLAPESSDPVAIAPWVEEGLQMLTHWQERIERLGELQGRLAAMAQEIESLKTQASAQAGRLDELRAENLQLGRDAEAFSIERDQLLAVVARIGELVRQATGTRPGNVGEATPGVGP